jgi:hypothetical protein
MKEKEEKHSGFSDTMTVAMTTAAAYSAAFCFEWGFSSVFGLSWKFVSVSINEMVLAAISVALISLGCFELAHFVIGDINKLKDDKTPVLKLVLISTELLLASITVAFIAGSISYVIGILFLVVLVTLFMSKKIIERIEDSLSISNQCDRLFDRVVDAFPKHTLSFVVAIIVCLWSFASGTYLATTQGTETIVAGNDSYKVISITPTEITAVNGNTAVIFNKSEFENCSATLAGCIEIRLINKEK